jgi:hypothetical protein
VDQKGKQQSTESEQNQWTNKGSLLLQYEQKQRIDESNNEQLTDHYKQI